MENNSGSITAGQFLRCIFLTPLVVAPVALAVYLLKLTDDPAAWVQAVGSVVAILAAWYIPYQHELGREKRRRQEVMTTIGALATRQALLFRRLIMAMENEADRLNDWQNDDQHVEWAIHQQVLNDFPLELLAGFDISLLIQPVETPLVRPQCLPNLAAKQVILFGDGW